MDTPRRHSANKAEPPRSSRVETPRRRSWHRFGIYVGNLPWEVDDSRLEELFSEHGDVFDARIVSERRGGARRSRGVGFVTMATEEETYDAVYALNKQVSVQVSTASLSRHSVQRSGFHFEFCADS